MQGDCGRTLGVAYHALYMGVSWALHMFLVWELSLSLQKRRDICLLDVPLVDLVWAMCVLWANSFPDEVETAPEWHSVL